VDGTLLDNPGPRTCRPPVEGRPDGRAARDRCPGLLELHPAADGMLARLRLPAGRATSAQLAAIAALAARGNGIVELTSRANVQVRGLADDAPDALAPSLGAAGLLPSPEHERVRNVLAGPLGGRHPRARLPADEIVSALDRGLCADAALADLPGRVLFLVEDGSGALRGVAHDVALVAAPSGNAALLVDGVDSGLRASGAEAAAALALRAAHAFLAAVRDHDGRAWSVRELPAGAAEVVARLDAALGAAGPVGADGAIGANGAADRVSWPPVAAAPLPLGRAPQRDGRVAVTALAPLGRLSHDAVRALAELAPEVRISPWRTVTVLDLGEDDGEAAGVERALRELGLVLEADSGWAGLSACAGLGACTSARADVRAAATARAAVRASAAPAEHWAACPRRCGERPGTPVAVAVVDAGVAVRRGANADEMLVADVDGALGLLRGGA
jgi:precorrin-3B synthase